MMTSFDISKNPQTQLPENWQEKGEYSYSVDDLIDAYNSGKQHALNEHNSILKEKFEENIQKAMLHSQDLINEMQQKGIICEKAFLRPVGLTKFDSLFIVPSENFLSDEFVEIYALARQKRSNVNEATFHISFSFMPLTSNINEEIIVCDGFNFKYERSK